MIEKQLEEITLSDIQYLSQNQIDEDVMTEYKAQIDLDQDKGKKEFIKDILGMANSEGGYFVIGMDEKDGFAIKGVKIDNCDKLQQQMISIIKDSSDPMFTDINLKFLPLDNGHNIIVIRVGKSLIKPHRSKKDNCFYKRIGSQCVNLDVANLKQEILFAHLIKDQNKKKDEEFVKSVLNQANKNNYPVLTVSLFPVADLYQNVCKDYLSLLQTYNEIMKPSFDLTMVQIIQEGVMFSEMEREMNCAIQKNGEVHFSYRWRFVKDDQIDFRLYTSCETFIQGILQFLQMVFQYDGAFNIHVNILNVNGKTLDCDYRKLRAHAFTKDRIWCNATCQSFEDKTPILFLLDELCNAAGISSYQETTN